VTGEPCPASAVHEWCRADRPLWNLYGPTEATCSCTYGQLVAGRPVDIGAAIPSFCCLVVDPDTLLERAPGVAGELVVCGVRVGLGRIVALHYRASTSYEIH
jgi:non-ribosomal peptide synthetase component F